MVPVPLGYRTVPQQVDNPKPETEDDKDHVDFYHKVYKESNLNTISSEFEFLSTTDPTEESLSDREKRKRTDPELMALIPGPESHLQDVGDLWGSEASTSLENILTGFDDLFVKYRAGIGRCTIAKHPVEVQPGAVLHREGARRMSPDKAARANVE